MCNSLSYSGHPTTLHFPLTQFVMLDSSPKDLSGEVDIDRWWRSVEKIVEGSLFFAASPMQIEAHKIAPWIPPACQGDTVVNTEFAKGIVGIDAISSHVVTQPSFL